MKDRLETLIAEMLKSGIRLDLATRDFERKFLRLALKMNDGSRLGTARALGIHRNTLMNKMNKYQLN